jgi:hypothetical protein
MAKKLDQLNQIDKNIGRFTPLPLNIWYDEASEVLGDKDTIVEGQ